MPERIKITMLLGTAREGRRSERVAKFVKPIVEANPEVELTYLDIRDHMSDYTKWKKLVAESDGFLIVTPEYNHGYPGELKMLLDSELPAYNKKAIAFIGVSSGQTGGARAIEQLTQVSRELGLLVSSYDMRFSNIKDLFDDNDHIKAEFAEEMTSKAEKVISELLWLAKSLRWGRDNL